MKKAENRPPILCGFGNVVHRNGKATLDVVYGKIPVRQILRSIGRRGLLFPNFWQTK
jgi:hypothetical protein